jgi:hypothetical protein
MIPNQTGRPLQEFHPSVYSIAKWLLARPVLNIRVRLNSFRQSKALRQTVPSEKNLTLISRSFCTSSNALYHMPDLPECLTLPGVRKLALAE